MPDSQTNSTTAAGDQQWDLLLRWRETSSGSLHTRIRSAIREAIRDGRVPTGATLPPSRQLAAQLGCSRWAVTEAYAQLTAEGYLSAVPGSGTTVSWHRDAAAPRVGQVRQRRPLRHDLAPGLPDLRAFPRRRWADALRDVTVEADLAQLGYPHPAGQPHLRHTLADYVVRTRGARAEADDVVVTTSVTHGVSRMCRELLRRGVEAVACEDPGWTRLRDVVNASGLEVVPLPTDEHGVRVDLLRKHPRVRAALVTPAHQFPSGTVLAPDRRADLIAWAHEVDGLVLEDDYDAEYRYDRAPVSTLQGMDPARVVLLKSVSKTLSPALGLGWMVPPRGWTERLVDPASTGHLPPALDQLALARLLETGGYDRHLRAGRARYRRRRDLLVTQLAQISGTRITGRAAGLHLVMWLPPGTDAAQVVETAAARELRVADLQGYRAVADPAAPPALVIGYGNIPDTAVPDAVRILATCIAAAAPHGRAVP
jgi:GntR family transcriptional regulator/MocR family aminotransferase